jgi:hypothetical protein
VTAAPADHPAPASVVLRFTPLPEHVRTARLVAASVARRLGLHDDQQDAVRLAVGEACGRAVQRTESAGLLEPVELVLTPHGPEDDGSARLVVVVVDAAGDDGVESEDVAIVLMQGLADHVDVGRGPGGPGGRTQLSWSWSDTTW